MRPRNCTHCLAAMLAGTLLLAGIGGCSLAANPEPDAPPTATPTINPDELNTVRATLAPVALERLSIGEVANPW